MKLVRRQFREWLESKGPGAVVGHPYSPRHCPIARFIKETTGAEVVSVGRSFFAVGHGGRDTVMPSWGNNFIRHIDVNGDPVDAAHALRILNQPARRAS